MDLALEGFHLIQLVQFVQLLRAILSMTKESLGAAN